jgi:hypothetical protein
MVVDTNGIYHATSMSVKFVEQGKPPKRPIREADRAEAQVWSLRMEGYGGRSSATAARPTRACRSTPSAGRVTHANLEAGSRAEMPIMPERPLCAAGAYDQADGEAGDHGVSLVASG